MFPLKPREVISVSLVAAALLTLGWFSWDRLPLKDKALYAEIGRTLGVESVSLLKPGGKITVIARDTSAFAQPAMLLSLKSLQNEIRRAKAEIRSIELIQLDPIRPNEVPSGDFYTLLRRLPTGDVIVSLLGPPILGEEERAKLGRPKAFTVALCTGNLAENANVRALISAGLLHTAIVNKPSPHGAGSSMTSFDRLYTILRSNDPVISTASL
jgi:hypothetical protein